MATLADTTAGTPPAYLMGLLPWHDPLDTVVGFSIRQGYYKPYALWREGVFLYEKEAPPALPQNQDVYLLHTVPLLWSRVPYTRVRFDQSSRRTQLLAIQHGQTFRRGTGLSFIYQRRTRTGEYLGQTTDHYGTGVAFYSCGRGVWFLLKGGWNQLQDGINGGVVYEASPMDGFRKERQVVRTNGARLRRWYRFAEGEVGLRMGAQYAIAFFTRLSEDRIEREGPAALRRESPLFNDSAGFALGVRQIRRLGGIRLYWGSFQGEARLTQHEGRADTFFRQSWNLSAVELQAQVSREKIFSCLSYRRWLGPRRLPPAFRVEAEWRPSWYQVGFSHEQRNLPWLAYLQATEGLTKGWVGVSLSSGDTTLPPLSGRIWLAQWRQPWLAETTYYQGRSILSAGWTVQGGWRKGVLGFLCGATVQRVLQAPSTWHLTIPALTGWVQPFLRWQLRKTPPVYQLGVRLWGFTAFRPLSYDLALGTFYLNPTYADYGLKPYLWADPYLVILVKRVMVYLRVEHVTEGWIAPGYYLSAWYPMPGRAFSFGVQWDIYN